MDVEVKGFKDLSTVLEFSGSEEGGLSFGEGGVDCGSFRYGNW